MPGLRVLARGLAAALAAALALAAHAPPTFADPVVPLVRLQGTLAGSGGAPLTGTYPMTLRLFSAETGGVKLWEGALPSVSVQAGVFDASVSLPAGLLDATGTAWLEATVDGQTLARQQLGVSVYALVSERARTAETASALSCTGCVAGAATGFNWAASASKGGPASDLTCAGCVEATDLGAGAVATSHLQDSAVTPVKASFTYAGSASKGGAATGLSCTGCVAGSAIAASATLSGNVSVTGRLSACTSPGGSGCAVAVSGMELRDEADGWLTVESAEGLRVRDTGTSNFGPLAFGGGTSTGTIAVTGGDLTVTGKVGIGTASPGYALDVRGGIGTKGSVQVGMLGVGSSGYYPDAALVLRDPSWWIGVVRAVDTPWADADSFVMNTNGAQRPFVWTVANVSNPIMLLDPSGRLGIGTTTPQAALDVAGAIRIGNDTGACTTARAGSLRWSGSAIEVCDGNVWAPIYQPPPDGSTQPQAGHSCASMKAQGYSRGDALYWIDPNDGETTDAFQVYCDMTTAGGGWTLALNLDTSDGHVMWWANALWTNNATHGTASASFAGDHKSKAWMNYTGATKVMVVVHEQGTVRGWKVFQKVDGKTMYEHMQGGDNTLVGSSVLSSSVSGVWAGERIVRLSSQLYANHCVLTGGGCVSGQSGSPDGDRIGSHEGAPQDNVGGGLGNWHDMNLCCSGTFAGKSCKGGTFRTASEAQGGWAPCYGGTGMFGTDTHATATASCGDSSCSGANWSAKNNVNYDYSIYLAE